MTEMRSKIESIVFVIAILIILWLFQKRLPLPAMLSDDPPPVVATCAEIVESFMDQGPVDLVEPHKIYFHTIESSMLLDFSQRNGIVACVSPDGLLPYSIQLLPRTSL